MNNAIFEETDMDNYPHEVAAGQGIPTGWESCPIAMKNKPTYKNNRCDAIHLHQLDDTNLYQWFGRVSSGYYYAYGKVLKLKETF